MFSQADFPDLQQSYNSQGLAICGDWMFALHDQGSCALFNLSDYSLVREFKLASAGKNNHCNVAFFGTRRFSEDDAFPLLYVSQANGRPIEEIGLPATDTLSQLLFVERVIVDSLGVPCGTEIVKLIHYEPATYISRLWTQDPSDPSHLYCYGNTVGNGKPGNRIAVRQFDYPEGDEFLVELTDADVTRSMYFDEFLPEGARGPQNNILQGGAMFDGIFILPIGGGTEEHPAEIFYADIVGDGGYGSLDVTSSMPAEPEDVDLWGDRLVCSTNSWSDKTCPFYSFSFKAMKKYMSNDL